MPKARKLAAAKAIVHGDAPSVQVLRHRPASSAEKISENPPVEPGAQSASSVTTQRRRAPSGELRPDRLHRALPGGALATV